jgi:hypothetical protein
MEGGNETERHIAVRIHYGQASLARVHVGLSHVSVSSPPCQVQMIFITDLSNEIFSTNSTADYDE